MSRMSYWVRFALGAVAGGSAGFGVEMLFGLAGIRAGDEGAKLALFTAVWGGLTAAFGWKLGTAVANDAWDILEGDAQEGFLSAPRNDPNETGKSHETSNS